MSRPTDVRLVAQRPPLDPDPLDALEVWTIADELAWQAELLAAVAKLERPSRWSRLLWRIARWLRA